MQIAFASGDACGTAPDGPYHVKGVDMLISKIGAGVAIGVALVLIAAALVIAGQRTWASICAVALLYALLLDSPLIARGRLRLMITRRRLSGASSGCEPHGQLSFGESRLISAGGSGFASEFEETFSMEHTAEADLFGFAGN